ncbi:hypothetical protein [Prochlorococcus sp. MIT 0604]|uniref:hypothetical protein n=1 Tax=Prochlorococcus sp. MIT 0604 TaxID=1501268 RepID=UPI0004F80A41|nr:hypothetical protein [Prochlorococcus sp. MIT 0604]AIQ95542.1 hypothetical protein EW14_1532 [Prochlorococcus sp. MIT 0604]
MLPPLKLFAPVFVAIVMPLVHTEGINHKHNCSHINITEGIQSKLIIGKNHFLLVDVTGEEIMNFDYDLNLFGMTSFIGTDILMTVFPAGNFNIMNPFVMTEASSEDTLFVSSKDFTCNTNKYKIGSETRNEISELKKKILKIRDENKKHEKEIKSLRELLTKHSKLFALIEKNYYISKNYNNSIIDENKKLISRLKTLILRLEQIDRLSPL